MKNKHFLFKNVKTSFWKKISLVSYRVKTSLILAVSVFMMVATFVNPAGRKIFAADGGDSLVSAIKVQEIVDGIGPFDADDKPGNDSSANNKIVRSFDQIGYTLAYATALKTDKPIESGYLMCSFTLPNNKAEAQWDTGQMAWMEDPKVTTNADGSQTLTGKKLLKNASSQNAIPGAGTLSAGIKVEGASNGTKISPTFKLWMENNTDSEAKSVKADEITVSAAPKVDVEIKRNYHLDNSGYYNFTSGKYYDEKADGTEYGRMQGYAIGLRLYNNDVSKGLKGIEIPTGDITFDIKLKEYVTDENDDTLNQDPNYKPLLWDYKRNNRINIYGQNGREMLLNQNTQGYVDRENVPYSYDTDQDATNSVFNGGNIDIKEDGTTLHVTVSSYKFNTDAWRFPCYSALNDYNSIKYTDNIGYFSAGYMQVLLHTPEKVTSTKNMYISVEAQNLKAKSATNQETGDVYNDNNKSVQSCVLYPEGTMTHGVEFEGSSLWANPDLKVYPGDDMIVDTEVRFNFDNKYAKSANNLMKFDTDGLEMIGFSKNSYLDARCEEGTKTILYAAKKDGTGWKDEAERNTTHEQDLLFYKSLDELKADGKICVGALLELRNCKLYTSGWYDFVYKTQWSLKMKKDAKPGTTYGVVSDATIWLNGTAFERYGHNGEELPTDNGYHNSWSSYYKKAEYDSNGELIPGTHSGGWPEGNTVIAVAAKLGIGKSIATTDKDGNIKTSYDVGNNERTAKFNISPLAYGEETDKKEKVKITDTLPASLKYIKDSATFGNEKAEPTVTVNSDGTSTLIWKLSLPIGKQSDVISYSCTIGKAGSLNDVNNNQILTNKCTIISEETPLAPSKERETVAEASITIIKLTSTSVQKSTDTPKVDFGQKFNYTFNFVNGSQNALKNVRLYDVFPYNGDGRNTNFNGSYKVTKVSADFSSAPTALSSLADMQATSTSQKDDYSALSTYTGWNNVAGSKSGTNVTWTPAADTKAIGLKFNAGGNEVVKVTVEFTPESGQKEGNSYINDIIQYADDQVQYVRSNRAVVQTRGNIKLKKVWDDDSNALKARPNTVDATIYQNNVKFKTVTLKSSENWSTKLADVPVYDSDGNKYKYSVTDSVAHYATSWSADNDDPLNLTLTNKYKTYDVTLSKKVTGNYGDRDHEFTFNVKITNAMPGKTYNVSGLDKKTFTPDSSGNASVSVKLKNGESAVFKDLPENATYQVSEAYEDYNASYAIDGANAVSGATSPVTTIKDNSSTIIYTNLREGVLPTGVTQHQKAIALACAAIIALLTVIWYMLKKRHKEENKAK